MARLLSLGSVTFNYCLNSYLSPDIICSASVIFARILSIASEFEIDGDFLEALDVDSTL